MKSFISTCMSFIICFSLTAQISINDDGAEPDPSAMVDINHPSGTPLGLLVPRMTTSQKNSISSPATGLLVYDTDLNCFCSYNGSVWKRIIADSDDDWTISASDMYSNVSGNVGIGTSSPLAKLDVAGHIWQTGTGASVFLGADAGKNDDLSGNRNTFIGYQAGEENTTGERNAAFGTYTLRKLVSGEGNVALGADAMKTNVSGSRNVAIGNFAGAGAPDVSNYSDNILIGYGAGSSLKTAGDNNIFIGNNSCQYATSLSNSIIIGHELCTLAGITSDFLNIGGAIYGDLGPGKDIGIGSHIPEAKLHIVQANSYDCFKVEDEYNDLTTPFVIDHTGQVGIREATPSYPLDVNGEIRTTSGYRFPDGTLQTTAASGLALPYSGTASSSSSTLWVLNTGTGNAIEGSHSTRSGYLAGTYGAYGTFNGRNGYLGGDYGAYGQYIGNSNFGYLGSADYGTYGTYSSNSNYGYLGGVDYGAYGKYGTSGPFGYLGGSSYGVYGKGTSGSIEIYGYLGSSEYAVYGYQTFGSSGILGYIGGADFAVYGKYGSGASGALGAKSAGVLGYSATSEFLAGKFVGEVYVDGKVGIEVYSPDRPLHVKDVMRLEPRDTAPSDPSAGDLYFDSSTSKLRCYDGSTWQDCW